MEYQINILKAFDALAEKWFIVPIAALVFLCVGIFLTDADVPDTYSATTTIYSSSHVSYRDSVEVRNAIRFYADIVQSQRVAERASSIIAREIAPEQIIRMISTSNPDNSAIFIIRAVSTDPDTAITVANAVATAFIQEVENVSSVEGVRILDTAYTARLFSSGWQSTLQTRAIAAAAGAFLSAFTIMFLAAVDKRAAFPHEATLNGEIELIGAIPEKKI